MKQRMEEGTTGRKRRNKHKENEKKNTHSLKKRKRGRRKREVNNEKNLEKRKWNRNQKKQMRGKEILTLKP